MEDYDYQLWYKHEAQTLKYTVAEKCLPQQLGIGISAGVETVVLGRQLQIDMAKSTNSKLTIASFDVYNAWLL